MEAKQIGKVLLMTLLELIIVFLFIAVLPWISSQGIFWGAMFGVIAVLNYQEEEKKG